MPGSSGLTTLSECATYQLGRKLVGEETYGSWWAVHLIDVRSKFLSANKIIRVNVGMCSGEFGGACNWTFKFHLVEFSTDELNIVVIPVLEGYTKAEARPSEELSVLVSTIL